MKKLLATWRRAFRAFNRKEKNLQGADSQDAGCDRFSSVPTDSKFEIRRLRSVPEISPGYDYVEKRILLYTPNIGGHRPLYSRVIVDGLLSLGYEVVVAYIGIKVSGREEFRKYESSCFDAVLRRPGVIESKIEEYSFELGHHVDLVEDLCDRYSPQNIILMDGDLLAEIFVEALLSREEAIPAPIWPIFILSEFLYRNSKDSGSVRWKRFHKEVFPELKRFPCAFYSDELLVEYIGSEKCISMPEFVDTEIDESQSQDKLRFYERKRAELKLFVSENEGKQVLLCFGDIEPRKGLSFFYRFCAENRDTVLVRLGRLKPDYRKDWDSLLWRENLLMDNRIFEMDCYVEDRALVDYAYGLVDFIALPYRNHYRTSGALIVSVLRSKPVIVSSCGLMAHRVKNHKMGFVYENGNYLEFRDAMQRMSGVWKEYLPNLEAYRRKYLSNDHIVSLLENALAKTGRNRCG